MRKVYARDNMNYMKPHIECYKAVDKDISKVVRSDDNKYIFFDDLLDNLESAKQLGWSTVWINPKFHEGNNYSYVDRSFRTLKDALKKALYSIKTFQKQKVKYILKGKEKY